MAADDSCSMEVAVAGGVHALVMLARSCKFEGVQEQVILVIAFNLCICSQVNGHFLNMICERHLYGM